jgi:hypothetical protein
MFKWLKDLFASAESSKIYTWRIEYGNDHSVTVKSCLGEDLMGMCLAKGHWFEFSEEDYPHKTFFVSLKGARIVRLISVEDMD